MISATIACVLFVLLITTLWFFYGNKWHAEKERTENVVGNTDTNGATLAPAPAPASTTAPPAPAPASTAAPPAPAPAITPIKTIAALAPAPASTTVAALAGGAAGALVAGAPGALAGATLATIAQTVNLFKGQSMIPLLSGGWTEEVLQGRRWAVVDNNGYYLNESTYLPRDGPPDLEKCAQHCIDDPSCALAYLNLIGNRCEKYKVLPPGAQARVNPGGSQKLMVYIDRWNSQFSSTPAPVAKS